MAHQHQTQPYQQAVLQHLAHLRQEDSGHLVRLVHQQPWATARQHQQATWDQSDQVT